MQGFLLSPLTMQVASLPLSINTSTGDFPWYIRSTKLLFFQKFTAVVVIVDLARIQYYEEWKEGEYVWDEFNIRANTPSPLLPQSSVKKGVYIFRSLQYYMYLHFYVIPTLFACFVTCYTYTSFYIANCFLSNKYMYIAYITVTCKLLIFHDVHTDVYFS